MDARTYVERLAQEAGITDESVKTALMQVVSNEKAAKMIQDDLKRHDEFSRDMDSLAKQKQANVDYYNKLLATEQHNAKLIAERDGTINAYKEAYGDLDGKTAHSVQNADVVTKTQLAEEMAKFGQMAVNVTKTAMWASSDYMKRFNEVLDPAALEAHAVKTGLPLDAAYRDFVAPKEAEIASKKHEEQLKAAREEGARDALTKHRLPLDTAPKEATPFLSNLEKSIADKGTNPGLRDNFVKNWNESAAGVAKQ